jgi:YNFM family putative membrane transporter
MIKEQMDKAGKNTRRLWAIQICIFLSGLSVFSQLYLFQPLLPNVASEFKTSVGDSSLLVSSSTIGMAIGLLFFSFKADAFSRKKLMVFSLLSSAFLTLISSYINHLEILVFLGVLKGFVISGVSAVALAYITEEVSSSVLGLTLSMYLSGNIIGGMSGRIFATLLAGELGWRNAVLIIGIESLFLAFVFWRFFPESNFFKPQRQRFALKIRQMKSFFSDAGFLSLYCIAALLMGSFVSVYNYLSFRLEQPPFSLNHIFIAFIFLMYTVGVFGTMLSGRWSLKYSQRTILQTSVFAMIIGVFCLFSTNVWMVVLGLGLFTFTFFAAHTMASRMVAAKAKEAKSAATSIYWLFYYFGSSVLGSGSGYFLHATSWFWFVGLLSLAVTISFFLTLKTQTIKL